MDFTEATFDLDYSTAYVMEENASSSDETQHTCGTPDLQQFYTLFKPIVYSIVFLLGLTGNGLMLTVLLRRRGLLRITEIYMLHLAVADLLLLASFPFDIVQMSSGVVLGDFTCKMIGLLNRLNVLSSSLLLACIGFDRYLAIVHAITSLQSRHPRNVHLTCLVLWLLCLALSIPNAVFLSVGDSQISLSKRACYYHSYGIHANNWRLTERVMTHVLCFFLPLGVMIYCYTAVALSLHHSQKRQRSLEKQGAIRLAFLVTAVFCVCWLPYNITVMVKTLRDLALVSVPSCESRTSLDKARVLTEILGYTHCCLNPLLYAFAGLRFRQDLQRLLARWGCGALCLDGENWRSNSRVSTSFSEGFLTTTASTTT